MTEDQIRRVLWRCIWQSRGSAPVAADYAYWVPMWPGLVARGVEINHPNYGEDRVLGWQAGGTDVAAYGPFANPPSAPHAVPPYPGDDVAPPVVDPPPTPSPSSVEARLTAIETQLTIVHGTISALTDALVAVRAPIYEGTLDFPAWLSNGQIVLTPKATP
jgi:hypothetical protein